MLVFHFCSVTDVNIIRGHVSDQMGSCECDPFHHNSMSTVVVDIRFVLFGHADSRLIDSVFFLIDWTGTWRQHDTEKSL